MSNKGFNNFSMAWLAKNRPEAAKEIFAKRTTRKNGVVENPKVEVQGNLIRLHIKPLSVNQGYTGQRWKTDAHRQWHKAVMALLPDIHIPEPPFMVYYTFGLSSLSSDGDNYIKHLQDILAERYGFNDKLIKRWVIDVELTEKGKEFFQFKIEQYLK